MPYAVQIEPDSRLRCLSLCCGLLLYLAGAVLLLGIPLGILSRLLILALWFALGANEWRRQKQGFGRVAGIRIRENGALECIDAQGTAEAVRLMGGSFVLPRLAWLRVKFADGSHYGELLAGDTDRDPGWHGLQLVWAQCGHRFGRLD
jgi:hypothetical protein